MDALLKDLLKERCDREGCPNEGTKRCSGCKSVFYWCATLQTTSES